VVFLQELQHQETLLTLVRSYNMITNYEVVETATGNKIIKRINEDGSISFVPKDLGNTDYQAYLEAQSTPSVD